MKWTQPKSMFTKILIANRGEIACRIIRTAKRLGIMTVAVYSTADENAQHVKLADEAYCIGAAPSPQSYLNGAKIIEVALQTNAQAIHPGYGFLSENAAFAEQCQQANLIFIGPSAHAIRAMGSKSAAKRIMEKAKVPLIPGYHGEQQDLATLQAAATKLQYPVLLKAAAGGGGKGMRIVNNDSELPAAIAAAKREALASFGDDQILIEKYFIDPRHVEIQVFADQQGNTVYLFERDCSIQRRHQKIIEEAPAPHLSEALRTAMGKAAVAAAKAINYVGAGTIEFLFANGQFYFMEMNTRLQVEHPVTEMITGLDLVEWQFKIAAGEALPLKQKQLAINGHAFEARIYAEDPDKDFLPSIGDIIYLKIPAENNAVRLDSGVVQGDTITPYYDPMLAKLIVWGQDRASALKQLAEALSQFQLIGIQTNLQLLTNISQHPAFAKGDVHTGFIKQHRADLMQTAVVTPEVQLIATLFILLKQKNIAQTETSIYSPWQLLNSWRMNLPAQQQITFEHNQQKLSCTITLKQHYIIMLNAKNFTVNGNLIDNNELHIEIDHQPYSANIYEDAGILYILFNGQRYQLRYLNTDNIEFQASAHEQQTGLTAPMPGKLVAINAKAGEHIKAGETLAIVEAMKMEHTIQAPFTGIVKEWYFAVGDLVDEGTALLAFEEIK